MSSQKKTTERFIKEAQEKHGDKYDYSKVDYINCRTKVIIICPFHGEFFECPEYHLRLKGCQKCGQIKCSNATKRKTAEEFIEQAKSIYGDRCDYSKTVYKNSQTKVTIICPKHGEYEQLPNNHLRFHGCKHCVEWVYDEKRKYGYKEIKKYNNSFLSLFYHK